MAGINKVILVGNLGQDPEIKYFPSGDAVCNFSIATSETWKDKTTGEKRERTEWHRIVAYRRLAEICGQYLSRGKQVYIEGKLQTRSWEKDGVTRYTTEIVASSMQMLGQRDAGGGGARPQGGYNQQPAQGGNYNQQPAQGGPMGQQNTPPPFPEGPEDDIPF